MLLPLDEMIWSVSGVILRAARREQRVLGGAALTPLSGFSVRAWSGVVLLARAAPVARLLRAAATLRQRVLFVNCLALLLTCAMAYHSLVNVNIDRWVMMNGGARSEYW